MPKKFVNPKDPKAGPAYPNDAADEETMRKIGYFEEGYPKQMYRDGEEPREVISSDEERGLGKGWRGFDEALCKIGGSYRKRYIVAVNNPAERANILDKYRTLHPALARADSWYKEKEPKISELQTQAMLKLVSDRQAEDRERRAIEAKATEAPAAKAKTGKQSQEPTETRQKKAGRKPDDKITNRNNEIATLLASGKSLLEVAKILDAQRKYPVPGSWMIVEDDGTTYPVKNFEKAYHDPQLRKKLRGLAYDVGRSHGKVVG